MGAKLCIFSDKVQKNLEKYPYIYILASAFFAPNTSNKQAYNTMYQLFTIHLQA